MIRRNNQTKVIPIRPGIVDGHSWHASETTDARDTPATELARRTWVRHLLDVAPLAITMAVAALVVRKLLMRAIDLWLLVQ
jgi:hypothetical protein